MFDSEMVTTSNTLKIKVYMITKGVESVISTVKYKMLTIRDTYFRIVLKSKHKPLLSTKPILYNICPVIAKYPKIVFI